MENPLLALTAVTYLVAIRKASKSLRPQRSPVYFFMLTFGLFLMSRVFIGVLVPEYDIAQGTWIYWGAASEQTVNQTLILLCLFLLGFIVTPVGRLEPRHPCRSQPELAKIAFTLMVLTAPFYAYRGVVLAYAVAESGYLTTFTDEVKTPLAINLLMGTFQASYYVFISAKPKARAFALASALFLAVSAFSLGTGQRTEFMAALILVYWCGAFLRFYDINFKIIALAAIPMVALSIGVNAWRLGVSIEEAAFQEAVSFLWQQGNTLPVIYGTLENSASFLPFEGWLFPNKFLSCDVLPYVTGAYCQNGDVVVATAGIWWQKLTYILDPIMFSEGGGLGGCVISAIYLLFNSESFGLNASAFFIFSVSFFVLMYVAQRRLTTAPAKLIYFVYLAHTAIYLPRAGFDALIPHPRLMLGTLLVLGIKWMSDRLSKASVSSLRPA